MSKMSLLLLFVILPTLATTVDDVCNRRPFSVLQYQEVNSGEVMDLDEILGNFGLGSYQVTVCALMGLVLMYSNISPLSYAITASDLEYRYASYVIKIKRNKYAPTSSIAVLHAST